MPFMFLLLLLFPCSASAEYLGELSANPYNQSLRKGTGSLFHSLCI